MHRVEGLLAGSELAVRGWFVGFVDTPAPTGPRWWRLFTRPGFRHIVLIGYDPYCDRWITCDTCVGLLRIELMTPQESDYYLWHVHKLGRILHYEVNLTGTAPWWRLVLSCTSVAKHALGLRRCMALTPYGLYRWLLRHGAKPVAIREPDMSRAPTVFAHRLRERVA